MWGAYAKLSITARTICSRGFDDGDKAAAVLYSVMASAKANQVEPWASLRDVLEQLAELDASAREVDERLGALLSDRWLVAHPAARRKWSR